MVVYPIVGKIISAEEVYKNVFQNNVIFREAQQESYTEQFGADTWDIFCDFVESALPYDNDPDKWSENQHMNMRNFFADQDPELENWKWLTRSKTLLDICESDGITFGEDGEHYVVGISIELPISHKILPSDVINLASKVEDQTGWSNVALYLVG